VNTWSQEVHNKIREQFRNMPDEFMTSTVAGTSKVRMITVGWFVLSGGRLSAVFRHAFIHRQR